MQRSVNNSCLHRERGDIPSSIYMEDEIFRIVYTIIVPIGGMCENIEHVYILEHEYRALMRYFNISKAIVLKYIAQEHFKSI